MVPGQYSLLLVWMIEKCRSCACYVVNNEFDIHQYVLNNEDGLISFLLILFTWVFLVLWRSRQNALGTWNHWYCCFLILKEVLILPLSWIFRLIMSRRDKVSANFSVCVLGDTQMLLHILQGIKSSAKRGLNTFELYWAFANKRL
jgi:hypothetical protein